MVFILNEVKNTLFLMVMTSFSHTAHLIISFSLIIQALKWSLLIKMVKDNAIIKTISWFFAIKYSDHRWSLWNIFRNGCGKKYSDLAISTSGISCLYDLGWRHNAAATPLVNSLGTPTLNKGKRMEKELISIQGKCIKAFLWSQDHTLPCVIMLSAISMMVSSQGRG
jgi:hypothetical protein